MSQNDEQNCSSPKVSVIVPVYNTESYLEQCIQSIRAQDLVDFEAIFVDDGSDDRSVSIIESAVAEDARFQLFHQDHKSAGAARNKGIDASKGKYLLFLDSDDWIDSDMLSVLVANAERYDSDMVVSGAYEFDDNKGTERYATWMYHYDQLPHSPFSWHDIPGRIFTAFPSLVWNKLFRRQFVIDEGIRFQEIPRSNDVYFMGLSSLTAKRISAVDNGYIHHRLSNPTSCQATKDFYPHGFLEARIALQAELKRRGLYGDEGEQLHVKTDFLNQALRTTMHMLGSFKNADSFQGTCEVLFPEGGSRSALGFEELDDDAYRNQTQLKMYKALAEAEDGERLFGWSMCVYRIMKARQARSERLERLEKTGAYRVARKLSRLPRAVKRRLRR